MNGANLSRFSVVQSAAHRLLRRVPLLYRFWPDGMTPVARSGKDSVSVAGVVPLSSDPTQSPAHSLVPLTVPTSLQPIGSFGFT